MVQDPRMFGGKPMYIIIKIIVDQICLGIIWTYLCMYSHELRTNGTVFHSYIYS